MNDATMDTTMGVDDGATPAADASVESGWTGRLTAEQAELGITPRVFTDEEIVRRYMCSMVNEAAKVVGEAGLMALDHPSMGSEDFSYYLDETPGCYVRFGARRHDQEYIPLHSPAFDIDEQVLKVGAAFFDRVARTALRVYGDRGPAGE